MTNQERQETPPYHASIIGQAVGGVLVLLAALVLPWVRYQQHGTVSEHSLGAGAVAPALAVIGLLSVATAVIQHARRSRLASAGGVVIGICGLLLSVMAAAGRMGTANDLTLVTGGATSWAMGAVVAVLASVAITVGAVWVMAVR